MKKMVVVMMLSLGISGNLFAQKRNSDKTFEPEPNSIARIYFIDLEKGDKMKIELCDIDDLDAIGNLDSLLRIFLKDLEPLKDSVADELASKRIDYIIDPEGKNKLRIQQFAPTGSSYLINQGSVAALKLEQDTLNLLIRADGAPPALFKRKKPGFHYFRISFLVNNLSNLVAYMDGRLQYNILDLKKNANRTWVTNKDGMMHVKSNPKISSNLWRGQVMTGDYLNLKISGDIQNYKNYFLPSVSVSATVVTNRRMIKREYSIAGESHFTFAKDANGKLRTYRNSFLTLGYQQVNKNNAARGFGLTPAFSLGYLIERRGDVYDKHSFRFGFGRISLFDDQIKIEPVLYFHDFFKGVTPGIRLSF